MTPRPVGRAADLVVGAADVANTIVAGPESIDAGAIRVVHAVGALEGVVGAVSRIGRRAINARLALDADVPRFVTDRRRPDTG